MFFYNETNHPVNNFTGWLFANEQIYLDDFLENWRCDFIFFD